MFPYQYPKRAQQYIPEMEPLQPNPLRPPDPPDPAPRETRGRRTQRTPRRPAFTSRPVKRTATARARSAQAKQQPRDREGKFAPKGWLFNFFEPKVPTKLKKVRKRPPDQHSFAKNRRVPRPKRKKKPLPERSFFERTVAVLNGDYAHWSRRNARNQARLLAERGEGIPVETKRRRRRKHAVSAQPPDYRRGVLRRFLPFLLQF